MKVIVCEPNKLCEVREIGTELKDLQAVVGGYIECVYPYDDNICLVCDEEGKLKGLQPNRFLYDNEGVWYDVIAGTFFLCGTEDDHFISLTDEQIERYVRIFNNEIL
jgi:predicted amidohydrolase